MTTKEMTEFGWLAAKLRAVANELERAHKLLAAAAAAEKLIAQVRTIATPGAIQGPERSSAGGRDRRRPGDDESTRETQFGDAVRSSDVVAARAAEAAAGVAEGATTAGVRLRPPSIAIGASRTGAVFDQVPEARRKLPLKSAGGTRPPF